MPLSTEQLADLQTAKAAGQIAQYYTLLASYGEAYGTLARSVADGTGLSGVVARGFAAAVAEDRGITLNSADWPGISLRLMQEDYDARVAAGQAGQDNVNLSHEAIRAYHAEVFAEFGLPPEAWTAYIPLSLAGGNAASLWSSMKQVDWVDQFLSGAGAVWGVVGAHLAGASISWISDLLPYEVVRFLATSGVDVEYPQGPAADWLQNMFIRGAAFAEFGPGGSVDAVRAALPNGGDIVLGNGEPFATVPEQLLGVFARGPADDSALIGTVQSDQIFAFSGNDSLKGLAGDDALAGGSGADTMAGGEGNDLLIGGDQGATEFLGLADDLVTYDEAAGGVTLTLEEHTPSGGLLVSNDGDGGQDILLGIEKLTLSSHDDRVVVKPLDNSEAVDELERVDAGANSATGDELDMTALADGVFLDNGYLHGRNQWFENFEVLKFGSGDDKVRSKVVNSEIYLGGGDDVLGHAGAGTRVWGGDGADLFVYSPGIRIEDASQDDRIILADTILSGAIRWLGSASPYATSLSQLAGFGLNKVGELVIQNFVLGTRMFLADYVGGPGAPQNKAGIYIAEAEIGFYRLFEDWPSHLTWQGGFEVLLGSVMKANFGVSMWSTVDPLVLDLDGDGLELTGVSMGELVFDIDGDGYGERSGWVGPDDGLLALDANGDGQIKDVGELFGGPGASGFAELATHDANADGLINASDAVFANLRVWRDLDQDRVVDAGELKTLSELGITSIGVTGTPSTATNNTNQITATGTFTRGDGSTGTVSDVAFKSDNQNTAFLGDKTVSPAAAALPELKGYGTLPDLRVAMTLDPTLQTVVSGGLAGLDTLDLAAMRDALVPILTAWAQASPVTARPPLLAHDDVPLLIEIVDGLETVKDFAFEYTDAGTGQSWWKLASGTAVRDAEGEIIAQPTLEQVQADATLVGAWSALEGEVIAFFERYLGELLPLDTAPSDAAEVAGQMTEIMNGFWGVMNAMAVRLAVQGPMADSFPGLRYDVEFDGFEATTPRQLIPSFEAIFDEADALGASGLARLEAWAPVLQVVIADYHQPDGLLNTNGFLFSNIVAAYESVGLGLGIVDVAEALGLPADLVRTGTGAVSGGDDADLFYLSAGNQTLSGGLGPDTYVVGRGAGQDVIDDFESASDAHSEDVLRFADIASTEVTARREGLDLIITVNGTTDEVRIKDHFDGRLPNVSGGGDLSDSTGVDFIVFADGVTWTPFDVARAVSRPEPGAQTVTGTDTVDWLDGGAGDDSLSGGNDADVYVYGSGYGTDVIDDAADHVHLLGPDVLLFGPDITLADVVFRRDGDSDDLIIEIAGETGSLRIVDQFAKTYTGPFGEQWLNRIDAFMFDDGLELSADDVMARVLAAAGTDGNDTIFGYSLPDDLAGGLGDDVLSGGNENDTYRYDLGDGHDVVFDDPSNISGGMTDRVVFGEGVDPATVTIRRITGTDDAQFTFADGGTLTVQNQFEATATGPFGLIWLDRIEQFQFDGASGVTWNAEFVMAEALETGKTAGADTIEGYWREDRFDGGAGNDLLIGNEESDTYVFGRGYGHDTVDEGGPNSFQTTDTDRVELAADVAVGDIVLERAGTSDDLTLQISGTEDRLTLKGQNNWFGLNTIEEVRFADGTVWTAAFMRTEYVARAETTGADTVVGFYTADTLSGGAGDDRLQGLGGSDVYRFNAGDGADSIFEAYESSNVDRLVLSAGLTTANLTVLRSQADEDDVTLDFGPAGSIFLDEQFYRNGNGEGVEEIEFGDGVVWTKLDLLNALLGATPGDDTIIGGDGPDTLAGLAGADRLEGLDGGDRYEFDSGDGADGIYEIYDTSDVDRLVLGSGLTPATLTIIRSSGDTDDITLDFGAAGSVFLDGQFERNGPSFGVEEIEFGDGTVWSKLDLLNAYIAQAQTSGADTVYGGAGADTLAGGAGNDRLDGLAGSDTYLFNSGDGADSIFEGYRTADVDRLILGAGLTTANLTIIRSQTDEDDVTLDFGAAGSIFLDEQFARNGAAEGVEEIVFGDGTVWTKLDLVAASQGATSGPDTILGGDGADTLAGYGGDDRLEGLDGSDVYLFNNGDGADRIYEIYDISDIDRLVLGAGLTPANLTIVRSSSDTDDVTLDFGSGGSIFIDEQFDRNTPRYGIEEIEFGDGTVWSKLDLLNAYIAQAQTSGADTVYGGFGSDTLEGGGGNDRLEGLDGGDTYRFESGDGDDRIFEVYASSSTDRLVFGAGLTSTNVTLIRTTSDPDDLTLSFGAGGSVFIDGQFAYAGANIGIEEFEFADGVVWSKSDLLAAYIAQNQTSGADTIYGGVGADTIEGKGGNDRLEGEAGADTYLFNSGDGADQIWEAFGSSSTDRLVFGAGLTSTSVQITRGAGDLDDVTLSFGAGGSVFINEQFYYTGANVGIEAFEFADGVTWTKAQLRDAYLTGERAGDDVVIGFSSADTLRTGDGTDTLDGGAGDDTHVGGAGDDLLKGNVGLDRFEGGDGVDTLDMTYFSGATVDLSIEQAFSGASAEVVLGIENLVGGSGTDSFAGDAGDNRLEGGGGNDTLQGNAGADTLVGGSGADRFRYAATTDSPPGGAIDLITDFTAGSDKIDLTAVDANGAAADDQAFAWIGTAAFSNTAGELRYELAPSGSRTVYGDVDGDGTADFAVQLNGTGSLSAADFLL